MEWDRFIPETQNSRTAEAGSPAEAGFITILLLDLDSADQTTKIVARYCGDHMGVTDACADIDFKSGSRAERDSRSIHRVGWIERERNARASARFPFDIHVKRRSARIGG